MIWYCPATIVFHYLLCFWTTIPHYIIKRVYLAGITAAKKLIVLHWKEPHCLTVDWLSVFSMFCFVSQVQECTERIVLILKLLSCLPSFFLLGWGWDFQIFYRLLYIRKYIFFFFLPFPLRCVLFTSLPLIIEDINVNVTIKYTPLHVCNVRACVCLLCMCKLMCFSVSMILRPRMTAHVFTLKAFWGTK